MQARAPRTDLLARLLAHGGRAQCTGTHARRVGRAARAAGAAGCAQRAGGAVGGRPQRGPSHAAGRGAGSWCCDKLQQRLGRTWNPLTKMKMMMMMMMMMMMGVCMLPGVPGHRSKCTASRGCC